MLPGMARSSEQPKEKDTAHAQGNGIETEAMQLAIRDSALHTCGIATPNGTYDLENLQSRYSPLFLPEESPPTSAKINGGVTNHEAFETSSIAIIVPPVERRWEYQPYHEAPVDKVIKEYNNGIEIRYLVRLRDGCKQTVSLVLEGQLKLQHNMFDYLVHPYHILTLPYSFLLVVN